MLVCSERENIKARTNTINTPTVVFFIVILNMSNTDYSSPDILVNVGSLINFLRKEYNRDFAEAVTSPQDSEEQEKYRDGLIFLGCFVIGIGFIWCCIILTLKIKGPTVGCAAGYAFGLDGPRRRKKYNPNNDDDGIEWDGVDRATSHNFETETVTNDMMGESISPNERIHPETLERNNNNGKETKHKVYSWRRETFTQLCFLTCCLITLTLAIIAFVYTLKPLVDAMNHSEIIVHETNNLVNDSLTSLSALESASNEAQVLLDSMTFDYQILCPNYTSDEIERTLGVDLRAVVDVMSGNYSGLTAQVSGNISEISEVLLETEDLVVEAGKSFQKLRRYLWILPTVLIPLCFAVTLALNGGFLSMRRQSSPEFRQILSRWVLPMLIIFSLLCFAIAAVLSITSAIGIDACLADSSSGSPQDTIVHILNTTSSTESWHQLALDIISGCREKTSNDYITNLHKETQRILNFIWKSLSQVDSVGQGNLIEYCGADEKLVDFLDGVRELAKVMYKAQRTIKSANETLSCEGIYPIYDSAVNELICDEAVSASAWGFALFFAMGIASLGIISLRASWSYNVAEDKIFDESEVVENIILDEHEEYLHYISAYKHEWEEYRGVTGLPEVPPNHEEVSTDSSSTESEETRNRLPITEDIACSEASSISNSYNVSENPSIEIFDGSDQAFNPYPSSDSQMLSPSTSVDNISFLSLTVSKTFENEAVEIRPTVLKSLPLSLLHERADQERDDFDDHLLLDDEDDSRDDDRVEPDVPYEMVKEPKSQVQIIKTKYKMIPSTMKRTTATNSAVTTTPPSQRLPKRPTISQILDELEELSTSKLATPSSGRNALSRGFKFDQPPSKIY